MYFSEPLSFPLNKLVNFTYYMSSFPTLPDSLGELLMPSGTGILGFHINGNYDASIINGYQGPLPHNYLVGQQTLSYNLQVKDQEAEIFGLALTPTAIWKMTGLAAHSFTNRPIAPKLVFAKKYHHYLDSINQGKNYEQKKEKALNFLRAILHDLDLKKGIVEFALQLIFSKKGCIGTTEIAKELHVSERHLQHLFRQQVGVSPLTYARITRFNSFFAEYSKATEPKDLSFLTSFYNFYDTSHFIKEFKTFCGIAPSKFHLEKFHLLKELVENDPYLIQIQKNNF